MLSDGHKIELVDDVVYEVYGKVIIFEYFVRFFLW